MRTFIFLVLVFSFIISGAWLMINKDTNNPYEIPYLGNSVLNSPPNNFVDIPEIVPSEEWESILAATTWRYDFFEPYENEFYTMKGEVEFKDNGTFFKYITWKYFSSKFSLEENLPTIVAGGSYSGTWKTNNNSWKEKILKCQITNTTSSPTNNVNVCSRYYRKGNITKYGQFNDDKNKSRIVQFNAQKIIFKSKSFATGKVNTYSFTRIK